MAHGHRCDWTVGRTRTVGRTKEIELGGNVRSRCLWEVDCALLFTKAQLAVRSSFCQN